MQIGNNDTNFSFGIGCKTNYLNINYAYIHNNDIDLLIPHQASGLAVKAYSKYGGFSEDKVINIIETTGNCVAASIPLALALANKNKKLKRNNLIYFIGTGAGLSVASLLLKF